MEKQIQYPYLPEGKQFLYVEARNVFMTAAKMYAEEFSLDKVMPGTAVVVKDRKILGIGANGSDYHKTHSCRRVELGCKSGEGYDLCEGCHPKNHSETTAINDAVKKGYNPRGADLYLWGHFWCCKPCWDAMIKAGIRNVYLMEGSERLFNKEHPDNIVGKQFEKTARRRL